MVSTLTPDAPTPAPAPRPPASPSVILTDRIPAMMRFSAIIHLPGNRSGMLTALWMLKGRWRRHPEASRPGWLVLSVGPFRMAIRLDW